MDSEVKLGKLDLFPNKSEQKINIFKSYPQNTNSSRYPKKNFMNKNKKEEMKKIQIKERNYIKNQKKKMKNYMK